MSFFILGQRLGFIATKAALVYILHEFEVEKDMETPIKITFDPKHFILKSKDALKIRFKKINVRWFVFTSTLQVFFITYRYSRD